MDAGPEIRTADATGSDAGARDVLRAVADDGAVAGAFRAALADAVTLYGHMLTLRLVSARMVHLQRTEQIAFHSSCLGEEAVIAAAALAARADDWVFPGVREWGAALVRGLPLAAYVHHAFGSSADAAKGHSAPDHPPARRYRVAPASGIPGAHVPQAVGAAWAAKIKKDDVATIALFDEAASATGDLHNALNFAGVFKPACVLVCRAHVEAPGSPARARSRRSSGGDTLASKMSARADAYGLANARVDGTDALAVLTVVRAAIARGAAGSGATLLEAVTAPLAPELPPDVWQHGGAELLALGEADPLARLRRVLLREGLADAAALDALAAGTRAALDAAVAEASAAPPLARSTIFDDVYADVPAHLRAQKES
jgi:pyruvate dehydrogenase E1 component alpha subunit/2-oxoisovalerate dehydrogenase E1 component alpha subunit